MLSVHACVFLPKMLFLDLDLDRDFSDSFASSYFDLWILETVSVLKTVNRGECKSLPAVADHAHALGFGFAVELGALHKILLAANAFSIAKPGLGKRINIAPS